MLAGRYVIAIALLLPLGVGMLGIPNAHASKTKTETAHNFFKALLTPRWAIEFKGSCQATFSEGDLGGYRDVIVQFDKVSPKTSHITRQFMWIKSAQKGGVRESIDGQPFTDEALQPFGSRRLSQHLKNYDDKKLDVLNGTFKLILIYLRKECLAEKS